MLKFVMLLVTAGAIGGLAYFYSNEQKDIPLLCGGPNDPCLIETPEQLPMPREVKSKPSGRLQFTVVVVTDGPTTKDELIKTLKDFNLTWVTDKGDNVFHVDFLELSLTEEATIEAVGKTKGIRVAAPYRPTPID